MNVAKLFKKTISIVLLLTVFLFPISFPASASEQEQPLVKVLFLGNSLFYRNDMDTDIFPNVCLAKGKNVEVTSITESGTTLTRLTSDKTEVGRQSLEQLENGEYDFVIISPSRMATPFESSVYNSEKNSARFIIEKAEENGAQTLVCAQPGLATTIVPIYRMSDDGVNTVQYSQTYMDRATHEYFYKLFCYDICDEYKSAKVVNIGDGTELLYKHYALDLYKSDLRHPNNKGSYLSACSIYCAMFDEAVEGCSYIYSLLDYNAIAVQRAAGVAVLGNKESTITQDDCSRTVTVKLNTYNSILVKWTEPKTAVAYNIYRKTGNGSFTLIATTTDNKTEYKDKNLKSGTTYQYKIKALNTVGELTYESRNYSSSASASTLGAVTFKSLKKKTAKSVLLKYSSSTGADKYKIYRKKNNGKFKLIATTSSLQYRDKKLKKGTYTYYIRGYNSNIKIRSDFSVKKTIKIK